MPVVVFYGRSPKPLERIERIQAPVLAHYGEKDLDVNQNIPATEEAMKNYDKPDTYKIYPGAQHGFHTETSDVTIPGGEGGLVKNLEFSKKYLQQ